MKEIGEEQIGIVWQIFLQSRAGGDLVFGIQTRREELARLGARLGAI